MSYKLIDHDDCITGQIVWPAPPVQNVRSVETVEVQRVTFLRGLGVPDSICREVVQYWRNGELLAEVDPR